MTLVKQDGNNEIHDVHFPLGGISVATAFCKQPNVPVSATQYARTTPVGVNVRSFDPTTNRLRGGSRPGLSQFIPEQVAGVPFIVQLLAVVVTTSEAAET